MSEKISYNTVFWHYDVFHPIPISSCALSKNLQLPIIHQHRHLIPDIRRTQRQRARKPRLAQELLRHRRRADAPVLRHVIREQTGDVRRGHGGAGVDLDGRRPRHGRRHDVAARREHVDAGARVGVVGHAVVDVGGADDDGGPVGTAERGGRVRARVVAEVAGGDLRTGE